MKHAEKKKRRWLVWSMAVCLAVILIGGILYVNRLRKNLMNTAIQNVMTVTKQQQQAFDTFIANDQERLHSYAEYFTKGFHNNAQDVLRQLIMFSDVDAVYSVLCLEEGWFCSSSSDEIRQITQEQIDFYATLEGSGIRDSYTGFFSGEPKFGYYETFAFANGHRGLIQKSYERSKISDTFSLSFYNDQGFAYVVDRQGDILLRASGQLGDASYTNIFDAIVDLHGRQEEIDLFRQALGNRESGSLTFSGTSGELVYTYVPIENGEDWYLVSVVPMSAITTEMGSIMRSSQLTMFLLFAVLVICGGFLLLLWTTQQDIKNKELESDYNAQLFNIFATHLSNNTDDVYLMVDLETTTLEYISPNVERVLGLSAETIAADLHILESAYVDHKNIDYEAMRRMPADTALEPANAEWINPKTGEHKWFQQNVYSKQVHGQKKLVIYISDRTRERKTNDNLREALQMAKAASDAKSAFLSSVRHDIRTPMNAIIGFLALMRNEVYNPEMVLEYTQRIDTASQHLLGLINDVLDMNKIESGSATLNITEVNLADVINEVNAIIRPQAKARNQTFDIFVSSLAYEHVMGDKLRINQVLINLLSNAVKYTQEGGNIQMCITELPRVLNSYSRIRFTVADNGMGMSEEYQKVIFDPFTREDTALASQIQGTGLGMAITKRLVELMGGTIRVESTLGEGSTFTVELELRIQEKEDDEEFWTEHNVSRMIVADDDENICRNIVQAMTAVGVNTDYATEGKAAVQMMREAREAGRPYDLILLDWKMPGLDGLATARLIRQNYPDRIPILLLTAYDWGEIEHEASEIGVDHFMPKPFFMSTFKNAIRRIMGGRNEAKEDDDLVVQGKTILVVDDIEVNRIILVKILSALGAKCDVAGNGKEAVETFEASEPGTYDLILMDVQMPVMDGYAATRAIRSSAHSSAQSIPIIAMTANAFVDDVRDAIESGMDAHIAKPVQLDTLKSTIHTVLENHASEKRETEAGLSWPAANRI